MRPIAAIIITTAILAGCAGGGTQVATNSQDQIYGPFQTRASSGKPQTTVVNSGNAVVTGVAGANFTKITYAPTPNLNNCRIAFLRSASGGTTLNLANADGSNPHVLPNIQLFTRVAWSRDGRLAVDPFDFNIGKNQIYLVNADGTGLHKISSGGFSDSQPSWSSDNFHIAFTRQIGPAQHQIFTMTSSGGAVTQISDGTSDDDTPVWFPDGTQMLFRRANGSFHEIWRMSSSGASPTSLITGFDVNGFALNPSQTKLMFSGLAGPSSGMFLYDYPSLINIGVTPTGTGPVYQFGSWSADGAKIIYNFKPAGSNTEIDSSNWDFLNSGTLISFTDPSIINAPAWEPFPLAIPYVSSTGGYAVNNASSGFLFSMKNGTLAGFVNVVATTPGSATLTADPNANGSGSIVFHFKADAITKVQFVNGFGAAVNSVAISAGTKEVICVFDALTGNLSAVLPLASKRTLGV